MNSSLPACVCPWSQMSLYEHLDRLSMANWPCPQPSPEPTSLCLLLWAFLHRLFNVIQISYSWDTDWNKSRMTTAINFPVEEARGRKRARPALGGSAEHQDFAIMAQSSGSLPRSFGGSATRGRGGVGTELREAWHVAV